MTHLLLPESTPGLISTPEHVFHSVGDGTLVVGIVELVVEQSRTQSQGEQAQSLSPGED